MPLTIAYTVNGDTVYIDDSNAHISATPHTLSSSGWVYVNLTSKTYTGDIDVAFGTMNGMTPGSPQLYSPHTITKEQSFTCDCPAQDDPLMNYSSSGCWFNYTTNPKYFWCYNNITQHGESYIDEVFSHSFDTANLAAKTAYWEESRTEDWVPLVLPWDVRFENHAGHDEWWTAQNIPVVAGTPRIARFWLNIPFQGLSPIEGKYSIALKPSGQTLSQAIANNNFYLLDPWFNSNWQNRIQINLSWDGSTLEDFPAMIWINDTVIDLGSTQADGDDIRFTKSDGETLLNYDFNDAWDNSASGENLIWVRLNLTSPTTTIYMYYNNTGATAGEDEDNTWADHYLAVWHLEETVAGTSNEVKDASGNANHGTTDGTSAAYPTRTTTCPISAGACQDFDGDDNIRFDHVAGLPMLTADTNYTLELWFDSDTTGDRLIGEYYSGSSTPFYEMFPSSASNLRAQKRGDAPDAFDNSDLASSIDHDAWMHMMITDLNEEFDADNWEIDGTHYTPTAASYTQDSTFTLDLTSLGARNLGGSGASLGFNGRIDEVRAIRGIMSTDYSNASFLTQTHQMQSYGGEETEAATDSCSNCDGTADCVLTCSDNCVLSTLNMNDFRITVDSSTGVTDLSNVENYQWTLLTGGSCQVVLG